MLPTAQNITHHRETDYAVVGIPFRAWVEKLQRLRFGGDGTVGAIDTGMANTTKQTPAKMTLSAVLDELEADNVFYDRMHRIHDESGRWDSPEMLRFAAVTERLRDLSKVAA